MTSVRKTRICERLGISYFWLFRNGGLADVLQNEIAKSYFFLSITSLATLKMPSIEGKMLMFILC